MMKFVNLFTQIYIDCKRHYYYYFLINFQYEVSKIDKIIYLNKYSYSKD